MHVAPPTDGLDTPLKREPPVLPEKMSELAVEALHGIVGGGKGPQTPNQARVHVGEERQLPHKGGERVSGLHEPLVGKEAAPLVVCGLLFQKLVVVGAPRGEGGDPCGRVLRVLDPEKPFGKRVEVDSRLGPWPCGRIALHLLERMEGAPLHARGGPQLPSCLLKATATIGDHHLGGRYAGHGWPFRRLSSRFWPHTTPARAPRFWQ